VKHADILWGGSRKGKVTVAARKNEGPQAPGAAKTKGPKPSPRRTEPLKHAYSIG
jgi:hypothetical protein